MNVPFDEPDNPHLPQHHGPDTVCYTGTHDNDTTLGWSSPAPLAVVPMQDLLGLGSEARMNRPGIRKGNWRWSFRIERLPKDFAGRLRETLDRYGRSAGGEVVLS